MTFYHFRSIFDNKIKKKNNQKGASRTVEMLVFCVNIYFQLKSGLCSDQYPLSHGHINWANILNILRIVKKWSFYKKFDYFKNLDYNFFLFLLLFALSVS